MHLPPLSRGPAQHLLAAFLLYCNVAAVPLLRDMAAAAPAQPQLTLREQLRSVIDACRPRLPFSHLRSLPRSALPHRRNICKYL